MTDSPDLKAEIADTIGELYLERALVIALRDALERGDTRQAGKHADILLNRMDVLVEMMESTKAEAAGK